MDTDPLRITLGEAGWIVLDAFAMLAVVIVVVRITGLRAFAKMSSFDFAVTVAVGSVLASVLMSKGQSFVHGLVVIAALFAAQVAVAVGRMASERFQGATDNEPLMLMDGARMLEANMRSARVTRDDLVAKLREANVLDLAQVRAVVLETTGDISVLHGDPDGAALSDALLEGVRRSA